MRLLREQFGHSQADLARLMQGHGFTWRQTTVAKTEAGNRPVRVNEAHALAMFFGVTVNDLLPYPSDTAEGQAHTERMALSLLAATKLRVEDAAQAMYLAEKQDAHTMHMLVDAQMLMQDIGLPGEAALRKLFPAIYEEPDATPKDEGEH